MKCPHCSQEHPDDFLLCPYTGKSLKPQTKVCGNPDCKYPNVPIEAKFCPRCGWAFSQDDNDGSKQKGKTYSQDNDGLTDYNIVLGKTTVNELEENFDIILKEDEGNDEFYEYELENGVILLAKNKMSPILCFGFSDVGNNLSKRVLEDIFQIENLKNIFNLKNQLRSICNKRQWQIKIRDNFYFILIQDKRLILYFCFYDGILNEFGIYYIPQCPHCNTFTQVQIDDIDNDDRFFWLRCKQCKKKFELFEQLKKNFVICPNCGSDDFEDDGSGYVQYTCNRCGHIWGDEKDEDDNEDEEDCDEDDDDELHRFFPVCGITLGETTVEEAEKQDFLYDEIDYYNSEHKKSSYYDEDGITIVMYEGIQFRKEEKDLVITNMYMTHGRPIFREWEDLGFDWNLSYNEWIELFKDWDYDIDVVTPPQKKFWKEQNYWYLSAKVRAIAPDDSVYFELRFDYGRNGYKQNSRGTLYAIIVSIDLEHLDM